ncbi:cellulose biosynthesis protein BcsE [Trinickia sp. LjRoot230]|uniref:cellulose biosynthesis protein BcsE n=1 Tax=Trinickia sp. LjRoot230 TaxID=3342288 RepID=UPI003ECFB723
MSAAPNRSDRAPSSSLLARLRAVLGSRELRASRLAIDALPDDLTQLALGCVYVVYAMPRSPGCDALIWESARKANTRNVTVVLARTREQTIARMQELGFSAGKPVPGWPRKLNVLAMPPHTAKAAEQPAEEADEANSLANAWEHAPPAARLVGGLQALKRFGFHSGALYLVEGAERWLSWSDPHALAREGRLLADWCASRKLTVVLFAQPVPNAADAQAAPSHGDAINVDIDVDDAVQLGRSEFHGACAGVARMHRTHGELLWRVDFWRTGRALVTGEVHALRFTGQGGLTVAPETEAISGHSTNALLARDEARVIATRAVVANEAWVPDEWTVVDNLAAAVAATRGAIAATVVLDYTDAAGLEPLCAAVHTLRRQCGKALKIVVVERRQALRHQYELLLLSLGANLLLGRDIPFSRLQSLLRSLQGQVYTRAIASDYKTSLAAALTEAVRGYLPLGAFCARVQEVLQRGAMLELPHVLARLTLLPAVTHLDALKSCVPRRSGDVFTADAAHLYVFLFACRLPDANAALARIFDRPVERWSDNIVFFADDAIGREVQALADASRRAPTADYSDLIPTYSEQNAAASENSKDSETTVTDDVASPVEPVEPVGLLERTPAPTADDEAIAQARTQPTRPRRFVEPYPMPVRVTEEK